jgi:hypothetical protein
LIVIQTALALFGDLPNHPEAILEFYMCMVWGKSFTVSQGWSTTELSTDFVPPARCFDVVVELPLYSFLILWRVKYNEHRLLSLMAYACCLWVLAGATVEAAVTIWLLNRSWHRWSLSFRVVLPLVFSLWISTQLYGAWRILGMARSKARAAGRCQACAEDPTDDGSESTNHSESRDGGAMYDSSTVSAEASGQPRRCSMCLLAARPL